MDWVTRMLRGFASSDRGLSMAARSRETRCWDFDTGTSIAQAVPSLASFFSESWEVVTKGSENFFYKKKQECKADYWVKFTYVQATCVGGVSHTEGKPGFSNKETDKIECIDDDHTIEQKRGVPFPGYSNGFCRGGTYVKEKRLFLGQDEMKEARDCCDAVRELLFVTIVVIWGCLCCTR